LTQIAMTSTSSLEITVENSGVTVLVHVNGRINVDDLRDCLLARLSTEPLPRAITVDLAGVPYIETSGIATLIEALRIARHHQTIFCLHGIRGSVLRLFEVMGVLALFEASDCKEKVS
jgi:anti-sigma B factor antagonist